MPLRKPLRSNTGQHTLLPAAGSRGPHVFIALGTIPTKTFLSWTFGKSTVIWRIWPAVLFHTAFAALVVTISLKTSFRLAVPNVLLTLLGVVIGFVISYRTMSGYDRYWQGRTSWSDIMRTSRTFGRLVWYHVPLRVGPAPSRDPKGRITMPDDPEGKEHREREKAREVRRVMAEKRMALDLIEGFAVATKHHLRGEMGIYYEDLYQSVKPLHNHPKKHQIPVIVTAEPEETVFASEPPTVSPTEAVAITIPPINSYGATLSSHRGHLHHASMSSFSSCSTEDADERQPLLPSNSPVHDGVMSGIAGDLIPFSGLIASTARFFTRTREVKHEVEAGVNIHDAVRHRSMWTHTKHRPKIAGGGENVPLQVVRSLTSWLSVMEERGNVPGTTLGGMFGCLAQFEDSLASLEKILTTPLPFVFSVHIRHTVWLYLFGLPFQLVDLFGWYAIPGVGIAAFIYLGFVATGEEIEQPFGYDENDLDLDMFCHDVIRADMEHLKRTPCRNALLGSRHLGEQVLSDEYDQTEDHGRVEDVFGYHEI